MSMVAPQTAVIGALIHITIATAAMIPSYCFLDPACYCDDMQSPGNDVSSDDDVTPGITCSVKSFSSSYQTISKLTPDITSLKLICSDPNAESHLTSGIFHQLPALRHLSVENCNFVTVATDAFSTVSNLISLEIKKCHFRHLPAGLFDETPRLSKLSVTRSGLQALPQLCSLLQLEELNVSGQPLTSLDECVADCGSDVIFRNLTSIDISNNSLTQIPLNLTNKAPNLKRLSIGDNRIHRLTIVNMSRLEILDATGQGLSDADFMVSDISPHIRVLRVEGNGEIKFPCQSLERLSNLTYVHLERFRVTDDIWAVIPSLTSLKRLALPSNVISFINLTMDSINLTHLNLSGNAVTHLDSETFASQRYLTEIDLSWNAITKVSNGVFASMTLLWFLNIGHNQLTFILQSGFRNLPSLKILSLSDNHLGSLPLFLLREMPALSYLVVSNNSITQLPYLTRSQELVYINASFNNIRYLAPTMFSGLPNLEYLDLRGNRLTQVNSPMFLSAPSLAWLDLRDNQISKVKPFQHHPNLKLILLDNNTIQDVSFVFADLPELVAVFLDNNYLSRLTTNMFSPAIHTLSVTENRLIYVEPNMFMGMPNLKHVNIGENNLPKLLLSMVQVSPSLNPKPAFVAGPNKFWCDCDMAYLKVWYDSPYHLGDLQKNLPVFTHLDFVKCATYFSSGIVPLKDVPLSHFVCPFTQPTCDESCRSDYTDMDANCTCVLTCPDACACFHGGSHYVKTYTHVLCNGKNLTEFPDFVSSRSTHLRLDGNNLTVLRNTKLRQVTDVMFLNLNNSAIIIMEDGCFQGLDSLQLLDLSNNRLTNIGELTFGTLRSLKELNLQHNAIDHVSPGTFSGLATLERLYLNDNLLKEIDTTALTTLDASTALTLSHNPWACSCRFAEEFLEFLRGHRTQVADFQTIRCFWYRSHVIFETGRGADLGDRTNASKQYSCGVGWTEKASKMEGGGGGGGGFNMTATGSGNGSKVTVKKSEQKGSGSDANATKESSEHKEGKSDTKTIEEASEQTGSGSDADATEEASQQEGGDGRGREEWCGPDLPSLLMSSYDPRVVCKESKGIVFPVDSNPASALSAPALAMVCVVVVAVVVVLGGLIAVKRRKELQAFLYVTLGLRLWDKAGRLDKEEEDLEANDNAALRAAAAAPYAHHRPRTYDAFVSFSHQDQDFVVNVLLPRLEQRGPRRYKLCVHFRDFPVGGSIADSIVDSVESSKRVLMLLSKHFLQSEWCRFEFRSAHQHVLREGGHRLIIILLEDVDQDTLDPDLKVALKTRTYLTLKDPWFWEKLQFAMPDVPRHQHDVDHQLALHRQGPDEAPEEAAQGCDGDSLTDVRIERHDSEQRVNRVLETLEQNIERDECSVSEIMSLGLGGSLCGDRRLSASERSDSVSGELGEGGEPGGDCQCHCSRSDLSSGSVEKDCDGASAGHCGTDVDDVIDVDYVPGGVIVEDDGGLTGCSCSELNDVMGDCCRTSAGHPGSHADDLDCSSCSDVRGTVETCVRTSTKDIGEDLNDVIGEDDVNVTGDSGSDSSNHNEVSHVSTDGNGTTVIPQERNGDVQSTFIHDNVEGKYQRNDSKSDI